MNKWQRLRLFFYLLLPWASLFGQQPQQFVTVQPDCMIFFNFTAVGLAPTSPNNGLDNRSLGCTTWQISYSNSGFSAVSLALQSAPDSNGSPGTYGNFSGTVLVGINPNTATTQAYTQFTGANPWVRVRLTTATGSGRVSGAAYGWRIPSANNVIVPSTTPTDVNLVKVGGAAIAIGQAAMAASLPVVIASNQSGVAVAGSVAAGVAPSGNPVPVSGTDGSLTRAIKTDTAGNQLTAPMCTSQAAITLSASGNTRIITGTALQQIRVCHISFQTATPEDIKLTSGTGATCGTGTADVSGLYSSTVGLALDTWGALTAPVGVDLCINQSVAQALGGIVIYTKF